MSEADDRTDTVNQRLSRWARQTGKAVSRWWEDLNALHERRSQIRRLARERKQLLFDMGAKVYTLHRRGRVQNRDLLADCERIDTIAEEIRRLELEIAEIQRAHEGGEPEMVVEDESPVAAPEDADVSTEGEIPQETDKEGEVPCAHAQTAAEGPADDEADEPSVECAPEAPVPTFAPPEPQPAADEAGDSGGPEVDGEVGGTTDDDDREFDTEYEPPAPPF